MDQNQVEIEARDLIIAANMYADLKNFRTVQFCLKDYLSTPEIREMTQRDEANILNCKKKIGLAKMVFMRQLNSDGYQ